MRSLKVLGVAAVLFLAAVTPAIVAAASPLDGLTIPPADPSLVFVAPTPDQPNYDARLQAFLNVTVPDVWSGQPVDFLSTYNDAGGMDALGLPTSLPATDPNNPNFLYQRFQNGVLFFNATDGTTSLLPVG
jgi:hypothetical protein